MLEAFKLHIETNFPFLLDAPFLLACSGGIDSMVLVDLCVQNGMDFAMAHCNFHLRGDESDKDERFVQEQAAIHHKKFHVTYFNTEAYATQHKVSVQMAARDLRYTWFAKIMHENGLKILVTAHHADDNLETFLINLSRGTGVAGLIGIPEKTDTISRPLLIFSKEQIMSYAKNRNIEWREDRSNADTKYLRNSIRHRILPILQELNPNFLSNFQVTREFLSQTAAIADDHIINLKTAIFRKDGGVVKIAIRKLESLNPLKGYLYGLFNEYEFTEWNDIENLLVAMSGKEVRSKTHRLVKNREHLLLSKIPHQKAKDFERQSLDYKISEDQNTLESPLRINVSRVSIISGTGANILYVSKKALKYPLTLRKWQKGDYFYPFGMQGKKKLSKFFKDEKVDILSKEEQWLLCSNGDIVWVVGRRADERFKVTESTEAIIKFELK